MERPHLRKLRTAIRRGEVGRVWVWRLDRLTRSGIMDTLAAIREMRTFECECASVSDSFALEGPSSDLVLSVLAWAAQMEREKIRENQGAARARIEAQGGKWGRPAIPDSKRQEILRLRKLGYPQRAIAKLTETSKTTVQHVLADFSQTAAA
jgi:DNA invertase Pin-like site-specific DNA recombinase